MAVDQTEAVSASPERRELSQRDRILVLAPTGDDAPIAARILREQGLQPFIVPDLTALAHEIEQGAGVALIASEALDDDRACRVLQEVLERQEPWSELPVLLFGGRMEDATMRGTERVGPRAQIVLLERPLGIATFVSATETALRSRWRQHQVKRLLDELAESALKIAAAHQEADRAKDDFLATLGHELRSPMTAIRGWIEMLKMKDLDPADAATALSMIESSTRVQAHIVEDLMDVSKIIAGKDMIERALVELAPLIHNVVATFLPAADQHGIALSADVPEYPMVAWVDDARLQQVGWNLISNAIKFTPRGGSVRVSLRREGPNAVIRIRDDGEGLSADLLPHVFERYRQGEGGTRKSSGGLGLGLAIVRHLVTAHDGSIEAFSEGAGKGAEFVVTLPLYVPASSV